MDNPGENKKLESRLRSATWKTPVVIEYMARDTPQQILPVEVGFMGWQTKCVQPCIMQTYQWKCCIMYLVEFLLQ